jgi:hypothetical protein
VASGHILADEALTFSPAAVLRSHQRGVLDASLCVTPSASSAIRSLPVQSLPVHERDMMTIKPHQHPHQEQRPASRVARLVVAILILAFTGLGIALAATGHIPPRFRLP